ncbi:TPA: ead/Ea22-like family protein [Pseudomonas aeruginosa]|uniref:ead/Ea22-like family protein n=1 Tax=Pseudomonas aeruginosa TaxID=287 RepID=UPI0005C5C9B7|nr:ead/Ea22-like family protein [Pseudomonas aeruginosa]
MTDHAELRRLAKAATPGPWTLYVPEDYQGPEELPGYGVECAEGRAIVWGALEPETGCQFDRDAEFIAAANPQAILALLDEIDGLKAVNEVLRGALQAVVDDPTWRSNDNTLWPKIIKAITQPGATSSP